MLVRPFLPASEPSGPGQPEPCRLTRIVGRVLAMDQVRAEAELVGVMHEFGDRHTGLRSVFADRFAQVVKDHLERFGQRDELDVVWG